MSDAIPTVDPKIEPEYVGSHSAVTNDTCQNFTGDTVDSVEQCSNPATHTVVMYDGDVKEIAMCDDCGEPDDVTDHDREWSE